MHPEADSLDDLIDRTGLSIAAFAKRAKIAPRPLLNIRRGRVHHVRTGTLGKLAKALGVDPKAVRRACELSRDQAAMA